MGSNSQLVVHPLHAMHAFVRRALEKIVDASSRKDGALREAAANTIATIDRTMKSGNPGCVGRVPLLDCSQCGFMGVAATVAPYLFFTPVSPLHGPCVVSTVTPWRMRTSILGPFKQPATQRTPGFGPLRWIAFRN